MATGLPKTKWRGRPQPPTGNRGVSEVCLGYAGKKAVSDILATPPASIRQLWPDYGHSQTPNRLYYGENLSVLAALRHDACVRGKVRLVYIDPPYCTKSIFQSRDQNDAYVDLLEGAHYLEFLRERLVLLRELLADDGSLYLHLDDNMAFHAKVLMDEVFGQANFRNWITRKKCNTKNYTHKTYGNVADYILFYTKSDDYVWHRPVTPWNDTSAKKEYQYVEPGTGRQYKKVPVHAPGVRHGETGQLWRGQPPPPGKHWQYPPRTLDELDARGEIYWSPTGNPRRKIYLDQSTGIPVQDIWLDFRDAHNQNIAVSGYPTEKNSDMLAQIIQASSNEGDLVLDCFAGSGTTLSVASQLGRHWIGVDNSPAAITTILKRFAHGLQPMGDFVNAREAVPGDTKEEGNQLALFTEAGRQGPQVAIAPATYRPILDFTLLASEPNRGDLEEALELWRDRTGDMRVLRVGETHAAYGVKEPSVGRRPRHNAHGKNPPSPSIKKTRQTKNARCPKKPSKP